MAESAKLKQGFTSNALCIDAGGTFMLPRLVGLARAMEIAALDEPIEASRALACLPEQDTPEITAYVRLVKRAAERITGDLPGDPIGP